MSLNLTRKVIQAHLTSGEMTAKSPITIKMDQTLTQDATGTMAYLQFEALGVPRVRTELSVSYVDHNTVQMDYKNPDDHIFLQTIANKYGIVFSRPGNGICHQLHLERFAKPGKTLIGSDSHTPTAGGIGSLAIGAGGLDVAMTMAGHPFNLKMPQVIKVNLTGQLQPWVAAKDVILEILRRETVKGGVGYVYEYSGPGVATLTVPERATITNMGAELGATTSIFPSDEETRRFLKAQGREADWIELKADSDATYDRVIDIDLTQVVPLAACPHMPDVVKPISELEHINVDQVMIGSCTNSSYTDLTRAALIVKGKTVHPRLSLGIAPGSRQVLRMLADDGALADLIGAGARLLESACGPCIGMGFAPKSDAVALRTSNRNFEKRSGTDSAQIYLVSPEVAAVAAIEGKFTDPRKWGKCPEVKMPDKFSIDDSMFIFPDADGSKVEIVRGPNIAALPVKAEMPAELHGKALIKVGDNITTDHIMPAGKYLPLRSNVPEYAKHVFEGVDGGFYKRATTMKKGVIIGGDNYGQGSSREHAALCPMYLGVEAVVCKSFARIHLANLVNFGILPATFKNPEDYDKIEVGDDIKINVKDLNGELTLENLTKGIKMAIIHTLSDEDMVILKAGGRLSFAKKEAAVR
ncbi:MAG: aconitate hydratase [Candidatus Riflebacteria bacterium]|nr:aconitate hydratase [Candidatus Riflebacteria bacterium]